MAKDKNSFEPLEKDIYLFFRKNKLSTTDRKKVLYWAKYFKKMREKKS
ncbi:hypothetical protein J7K18_07815 [bacterium]|nr:hypothetical protein [bacterium]